MHRRRSLIYAIDVRLTPKAFANSSPAVGAQRATTLGSRQHDRPTLKALGVCRNNPFKGSPLRQTLSAFITCLFASPGLSLRSNPGLELANAFGVFFADSNTSDRLRFRVDGSDNSFIPSRGSKELELIRQSNFSQIARDWNAQHNQDKVGYVTRFAVRNDYLKQHVIQTVGSSVHQEYWIPAGEMEDFNRNLVGPIEVVAEFRSDEVD